MRGLEAGRGSAHGSRSVSDDGVQLIDGQRYEGSRTWRSSSRLGARNVSFIQLGRVEAPESATESRPLQGVWEDADACRPWKAKREDWREKEISEADSSGHPEDETRHESAEAREPLVVDILLGLLQDDVWVHLDEAAKWNAVCLVRWTLMLARGTTGRAVLPAFIGDAGSGGIWYMRVVLLDLLLQTIWEAAHHHPGLLGFTRALLVVRLCESAGAAFASSSSLGLLLPLLRVLGERYVCVLKSLSSLAVSSGRHRASASSLVGHFVALAQAVSSLLLLPLYPRLGLNGAMTSEGPADALDETPIGETTMKPSVPLDAHKWRLGDRKGQTARGEKGGRERHEALSRVRDACDTAEERLDCRMLDLPSSPASRAASATTSPSARSRCISERREEPAMSVEVFKSGDELEGVASVAGDGTESDDYGSEEETSSAWKIPVLSSQLLNHAAIISTLKHAARGPMGLSALPWFSSRFCAVPASHVNGGPMDTCGDLGGTRLETVPSLVALAAPSSSCVTSSLPVSLLLASLSHASAVLEALVQQQRQMTTTVALDSGDSSSLTFSPQFVFASFSRVLQLLLLLLPRALTRGAVPLLLAPPFLPSISTLASHSAALPGRQTSSGVDPGPGIPPLRVFSSALFPPSPWLLELFSVLVLRHPSLISPSSTDALLRYLLPHVLSPDPKGAGPWRFDAEKTRRPSKSGSRKNTQEEASLAEETGLTEHPMARLWMPYAFARPLPSSSASRASTAWASLASLSLWSLFPLLLRNMARRGTMEDADSAPLQSNQQALIGGYPTVPTQRSRAQAGDFACLAYLAKRALGRHGNVHNVQKHKENAQIHRGRSVGFRFADLLPRFFLVWVGRLRGSRVRQKDQEERQQQREAPGDRSRVRKSQDELNDSSPDPSHVEALWKLWTESFVILQSQGLPSQPVCFACDLAHGADAVPVGRRNHGEGLCFVAEKGQKVNDAEAGREKEIWERDAFRVHSGEQAGGYAGDRQEKGPRRSCGASVIPSEKPGVNAGESTGEAMHGGDRRDVRRSEWMSCDGAKATGRRAFGVEWESQRETQLMALESSGSRGPVASPEVTATGSVAYWRLYSFSSSPRLTCMHLQLLASLVVASVSRSVPARTPLDSSCRRGEALSLRLSSFFLNSGRLHETIQGRWTEDNEDEEHASVANAVAGRWSRSSDEDREVCREVSVLSSFSNRNTDTEGRLGKAAAFAETDTEMDAGKSGDVFESSQDALVPSTFTLMRLLLTSLSVFSVFSSAPDSCFCPCSVQLPEAIRGFKDRRGKEEVSPLGSFLCTHNMRGCTTNGKAFDPSTPVKERDLCMHDPGEDRQDNLQASVEFFCQDLCETKSHPTTCGASDKGAGVSVSSFAPLSGTGSSHPAPFHHRPLWAVCVELLHALVAGASASSFLHLEAATRGSEPASSRRTSWESIAATDGDERMSRDGCRSSFLASETDAGERQRQGMSHDHPEGERQELRYGCERLVRPLSSFSSSLSRSPASLEALWARGGGPAIFGQFFECMRIEDPQTQRLAKGEGDTFVGRDEAGKRTLSLLDAVASVTAMEASLALLQPIASTAMRGRRFGVSDTPLSNKQTAKCAALDGFNLAPMFGLRFGRTELIVGSYTEPPSPSSPAGHFLKKAMNAKSVLTAVVEIFSEHTPMFGEEMEERDPHTLGPEPLTASCPGGFSVLPAALSVVGQLIAELLALARREQAAVGKAVVDVLASLIVERNAPLLLGREQEKEESDVEDFSGRAVDEASEATRSQASDASKGRGSGMGETETPLTDNDLNVHDGRGDKNKEIWVLSAAAREERHQRQSRKGDGPDLRLQDNKDYQLEPTMAEVSLRLAPSTVCVLLEAFEAAEVFRDLLKPSPCHAAVSAGGDEHLTHAAGSRNQFQSSATATDWSHGYIPCGDLVSLLALSAACVGVPDLTGDALWALLQGHDLAAAALSSLHVSHRYLPMSDRAPSMLSASSELPSAPEIVPSLPRHRSGLHQLSRCNLADADGLACNAPALRTGRDKDGEWISEEPRKESGKDWQAGRETVAVVRDILSTALSRLASPLREALSHVLSMIADHQSLPSVQELCLSHLPFFFVQWLSLRKRVRHAHDSTVGVRTRFEMLEAHALVEEAKASERGGEIRHSRIPDLPPKRSSCVQLPLEGYPQVTAISCQQWLGGCLLKLQSEPTGTEKKRVTDEESTLILTFADCDGFFSGLAFLTACEALARCLSPPPQGVPADNPEVASSEACDEEGMDSSHSDAATRREGHRGGVVSATLSARDAANLGGGNRGRTCWGLGDSSYGATGRGDSARAKAWALRQLRPVFVNARQEASFYLRVSSAANELLVQNPRHERCLSGALSCHELVSLLFRFFAPFADETAERKETRSQTRRLFNHEELEEKRENPKTKQQVQPIQLLTVLGLVATSATLCDPGAPHALRVVALLSLQNVRPPGGKRLSPSLLSSLSVTSSLSSSFPASYRVGRGNLRGLSTAALSRHAEPGRAEDESEPANELEIEDVERLARMIGCASPSMALITSTVAQISREDDAPALLNL
ncbi:hypothetical protein TGFOU_248540B [Toxoplasma gondii FOU]|uniref:Uncharacterized protein n=1 Tax=Toxoplasma gondii FOU TaxID=943167 RepID=A0A086LBU8_TOXGO|nr:hypothetical protein TGFOU_248540B [Toxoplasma gondii FOU]